MQKRRFTAWPLLGLFLLIGLLTASLVPGTATVDAQGGDFEVYADFLGLDAQGDSGTFEIGVRALDSTVAAVDGEVSFDATALTVTNCVSLVPLGACNAADDGTVKFAAVLADGFVSDEEVALFDLTVSSDGPNGTFDVDASLTAAYDAGLNQVVGALQDGAVTVGGLNGDVNCDNRVNILDAYHLSQATVDIRTPSACPLADPQNQFAAPAGDVTGDGRINIQDAYKVSRCAVNLETCD